MSIITISGYLFMKIYVMKKKPYTRKCTDKYNRKPVIQFKLNGTVVREWTTVGEICRELGMDKSAILRCCKGKQKKSYWFVWKFKEDVDPELFKISHENNEQELPDTFQETEGGN